MTDAEALRFTEYLIRRETQRLDRRRRGMERKFGEEARLETLDDGARRLHAFRAWVRDRARSGPAPLNGGGPLASGER